MDATEKLSRYRFFDQEVLLQNCNCEKTIMDEVVSGFISHFPKLVDELQVSVNQKDTALAKKQFHKMKSTIGIIAIEALAKEAEQLEKNATSLNPRTFLLGTYLLINRLKVLCEEVATFQNGNK